MRNFTRTMLVSCHMEVRNFDPHVKVSNANVTLSSGSGNRKQYFFQFQQQNYLDFDTWVTADDAYDAKCKGWDAWMARQREMQEYSRKMSHWD